MKKEKIGNALWWLGAFVLWTAAVCLVDVQPIGPRGTEVGFATANRCFHRLTGVHMGLYVLTDWLSLVPLAFVLGFGLLGLGQWIRRRSLWKVDPDLLLLGGFYGAVLVVYGLFEVLVVNYRPILIEGALEASYPSSTTVLVLCVLGTAKTQLRRRMKSSSLKKGTVLAITVFAWCMVAGRLLSGVHWLTDIVGGILVSGGLVRLYAFFAEM